MTGLREILERGLPEAPGLDGLAGRVESGARRRRVRRRAGLVVGAVAVAAVASVTIVATTSGTTAVSGPADRVAAPDRSAPVSPPVPCRPEETDRPRGDAPARGAVSVRLCRLGPSLNLAVDLVPQDAVTTGLPALVAELNRAHHQDPAADCVLSPSPSDQVAQVGYADGTTWTFPASLRCGTPYRAVMTALGRQEAASPPAPDLTPLRCPPLSRRDTLPTSTEAMTRLPATDGVLCRYSESPDVSTRELEPEAAEAWRLGLLGADYTLGTTRCTRPTTATRKLVLRLADGSRHEASLGPCGDTHLDGARLGLTDPDRLVLPTYY